MTDDLSFFGVNDDQLTYTQREIDVLAALLNAGDRGAFHYLYAEISGVQDALLTTSISTFSGAVGGAAFGANRYLQSLYGQDGTRIGESELYTGIYDLSQDVAREILTAITASARLDGGNGGILTEQEHFGASELAWQRAGIADQFPGNLPALFGSLNAEFTDVTLFNFLSNPGVQASVIGLEVATYTGKRLSDFAGPEYEIIEVLDGVIVTDQSGRTVASFLSNPQDFQTNFGLGGTVILDAFRSALGTLGIDGGAVDVRDNTISLFTGVAANASETLPTDKVFREARRGFSEFSGGFTGDVNPAEDSDGTADPFFAIRASGTDGNDIIFGSDDNAQDSGGRDQDDTINAKAGDDVVVAAEGDDIVLGGAGDDIIYGQDGDDTLRGEEGSDLLRGGLGEDILSGGEGDDILDGGGLFRSSLLDVDTSDEEALCRPEVVISIDGIQVLKTYGYQVGVSGGGGTFVSKSADKIYPNCCTTR